MLDSIHIFTDAEVITADNLNSIGEGVSNEVGTGNILPSSIVWPLVALGNIDMNGYSIINSAQVFGVYHVNDDQSLNAAVAAVNSDGGGVIKIDPGTVASASDLTVSASNVTIMSESGAGVIDVAVGAVSHGIKITGNNCRIMGCRFTGGAAGIPSVVVGDTYRTQITGNIFEGVTGIQIGDAGLARYAMVNDNHFANISGGPALYVLNALSTSVQGNLFDNNTGNDITLGGDEAGAYVSYLSIGGNTFIGGDDYVLYGSYTGGVTANKAYITISGNTFEGVGDGVYLRGYFRSTITANQFTDKAEFLLESAMFSSNNFNSIVTLGGTSCLYSNNFFGSTVTWNGTGTNAVLTGNYFVVATQLPSGEVISAVGNVGANNFTLGSGGPDVFGLNWGLQ